MPFPVQMLFQQHRNKEVELQNTILEEFFRIWTLHFFKVSFVLKEERSNNYDVFQLLGPCNNENVQETYLAKVSCSQFTQLETFYSALAQSFT